MQLFFDAESLHNSASGSASVGTLDPTVLLLIAFCKSELQDLDQFRSQVAIPFAGLKGIEIGSDSCLILLPVGCFAELLHCQIPQAILSQNTGSFLIPLVDAKLAPAHTRSIDSKVVSFISSADHAQLEVNVSDITSLEKLLFHFFARVMASPVNCNLKVKQLRSAEVEPSHGLNVDMSVASVTAHRGDIAYLASSISTLCRQESSCLREVLIGLDESSPEAYASLKANYPEASWYFAKDAPVGPYVLRQFLAAKAASEYLLWLDSDDLSCSNRLAELLRCLANYQVDMVGSHALEVDEICEVVRAVRYPLNVTAVLADNTRDSVSADHDEPLLHATALISRAAFLAAGGFATTRRIASDSQFLLRAHFTIRIRNVDEFLYVRRIHRNALTVAEETKIGNDFRKELGHQWNRDFRSIKEGRLQLGSSSLMAEAPQEQPVVLPFPERVELPIDVHLHSVSSVNSVNLA